MTSRAALKLLVDALNERKDSGCPVQLWLRDDDAVEPTKPLDRLLEMADRHAVPITLAVIPAQASDALAARLASADCADKVTVAVHGWSHQSYAPVGEKKQELGLHRPLGDILAELARGSNDLARRHGSQFVPLLVPPWNRIDPAVIQRLPSIGFRGLSTFGNQTSSVIDVMNTHVDVIDWKGSRGGRATADLVAELAALISKGSAPIGILSHHLIHDQQAWKFLKQLLELTSAHSGARWLSIKELLPALSPNP